MEIVALAVEGGSFMAEWVPKFIARRYFTVDKLSKQIALSLRSQSPIHISGSPTMLSLWFSLVNQSSLDLRIDSIAIEAWFGQPIAMMASVIPIDVPRRSQVDDIRVATILPADVTAYARKTAESRFGRLHFYVTLMCKTTVRDFILKQTFEREASDAKFDGLAIQANVNAGTEE